MRHAIYPPQAIAESSRLVLGEIDFAPYLPEGGNKILQAKEYRPSVTLGLLPHWNGNIWIMPPPYHSAITPMTQTFVREVIDGNVKNAILVMKAAVHTVWFRQLCKYCDVVCFPCGKLMCLSEGTNDLKEFRGLAIFYKGNSADIFKAEFSKYGICMEPDHTVYNVIP